MVDYSNLKEKLASLSGNNFEQAERQERAAGNDIINLTFTSSFRARIAAIALGVTAGDIKDLPLKDYTEITNTVYNFFYGVSDEAATLSESTEDVQ